MKTIVRPGPAALAATVRALDDTLLGDDELALADAHAAYPTMNPLAALVAYGAEAHAAVRVYHLTKADHVESGDVESDDAEGSDTVRISAAFTAAIDAFAAADRSAVSF